MPILLNRSTLVRIASGLIAVAALWTLFSMGLCLVWADGPGFFVAIGSFLVGAFSWAALYVPLWLACLALLIVLPGFHPRLLYLLSASLLPFLVLAAYARVTSNPVAVFNSWPLLAAIGLPSIQVTLGVIGVLTLALVAFGFFRVQAFVNAEASRPELREDGSPAVAHSYESVQTETRRKGRKKPRTIDPATFDPASIDIRLPKLPPRAGGKNDRSTEDQRDMEESGENGYIPGYSPQSPGGGSDRARDPTTRYRTAGAESVYDDDTLPSAAISEVAQAFPGPAVPHDFDAEEMTMLQAVDILRVKKPGPVVEKKDQEEQSGPVVVTIPGTGAIEFTSVPPQHASRDEGWAGEQAGEAAIKRILARKKEKAYEVPVDGILNTYPDGQYWIIDDKTRQSAEVLRATLAEFGIEAEVTGIRKGPVITMFEILPAPGVKLSKITNLGDNIALRLAASSVRIVAPIPGKHAVGIEVPNEKRAIVSLREIVDHEAFKSAKMEIPVVLGKDIAGEVQFIDLTATPHLLIAGATGSGKSVCVNSIILSILYRRSPADVKLLLIDPKIVELKLYNDIPHLLTPVITEPKRAFQALQYCICEMERRYSMLDKVGVRDIKSYNRRVKEKNLAQDKLPYIVVIVDEFADLMATTGKELESTLARLAAMSRAVGIHLVLATQRPSIDVITGLIKANIPSRIAFMVAGKFDSRIIIDMVGAEKLLGRGDMLFSGAADPFPVRMQGAFVSDDEVEKAVEFVRTLGEPEYIDDEIFFDEDEEDADPTLFDDGDGDPLFEKALEIVMQQGKASASYIQRRLKVGYNRAARLVELMEQRGIVGPAQGSKPRDLVRNPDIAGRNMTGDSPGRIEHSGGGGGSGAGAGAARRRDLLGDPETVPGQRVTGRDED